MIYQMICVECGGVQFQFLDVFAAFMALGCFLPLFVGVDLLLIARTWFNES